MFRDALRANPTWRSEYALLKLNLASAHADDRIAYNKKKTDFIKSTLKAHRAQLQQAKASARTHARTHAATTDADAPVRAVSSFAGSRAWARLDERRVGCPGPKPEKVARRQRRGG